MNTSSRKLKFLKFTNSKWIADKITEISYVSTGYDKYQMKTYKPCKNLGCDLSEYGKENTKIKLFLIFLGLEENWCVSRMFLAQET